jgi:hypothetical protein
LGVTVYRRVAISIVLVVACLAAPLGASADQRKPTANSSELEQSTITGNAFQGASGSIKVNETAGNGNAQANITVLSATPATVTLRQTVSTGISDTGNANITGNAFAGTVGAIQLNQSAGSGNAQGNVIVVQLGGGASQLSDDALSQSVASDPPHQGNDPPGGDTVTASGCAFHGSSGVVQINQVAGSSNRTMNSFQLQLQTGPGH